MKKMVVVGVLKRVVREGIYRDRPRAQRTFFDLVVEGVVRVL